MDVLNIRLFTLDGKELLNQSLNHAGNSSLDIHTGNFPSGVYLLKACSGKGQAVKKVVVQK